MKIIKNSDLYSNLSEGVYYANEIDLQYAIFDLEWYNGSITIYDETYNSAAILVDQKLYDILKDVDINFISTSLVMNFIITEDMHEKFFENIKESCNGPTPTLDSLKMYKKSKVKFIHTDKKKYLELKLLYAE